MVNIDAGSPPSKVGPLHKQREKSSSSEASNIMSRVQSNLNRYDSSPFFHQKDDHFPHSIETDNSFNSVSSFYLDTASQDDDEFNLVQAATQLMHQSIENQHSIQDLITRWEYVITQIILLSFNYEEEKKKQTINEVLLNQSIVKLEVIELSV